MTVVNPGGGGGGGGAAFTQGTAAAKPAATANALYYATDTGEWWIANAGGSAWQSIKQTSATPFLIGTNGTISSLSGGGSVSFPAGAVNVAGVLNMANNVDIFAAGKGVQTAEGANCKQGVATLAAGSAVVANTSVTASSRILVTSNADGGTPGWLRVSAKTPGTSFTITSSSGTDTSSVAWEIFEPGV